MTMLHKQMMKLIHPSGVFVQRYNQRPVSDDIVRSLVAFGLMFFITIILRTSLIILNSTLFWKILYVFL